MSEIARLYMLVHYKCILFSDNLKTQNQINIICHTRKHGGVLFIKNASELIFDQDDIWSKESLHKKCGYI